MIDIFTPKDIESENGAFGLFDCPHCDEEFTWGDDFDNKSVSSKYMRNLSMVNGVEVGLAFYSLQ